MSGIKVIRGEIFDDHRGRISSLNAFRFPGVERFYVIRHPDTRAVRGWHGHRFEKKWFYCIRGGFTLALVRPDDWENPSPDLTAEIFTLSEERSLIVCVPEGYANCLKASQADSVMLVFSGKVLEEALNDSWRYDPGTWVDWSKY